MASIVPEMSTSEPDATSPESVSDPVFANLKKMMGSGDTAENKKEKNAMLELGEELLEFAGKLCMGGDTLLNPIKLLEKGMEELFELLDENKGPEAGAKSGLVSEDTLNLVEKAGMAMGG